MIENVRYEWITSRYKIFKTIKYPVTTSSLNELSKCTVSGTGKRISKILISKKELATIELLFNFKTCSCHQLKRYLEIRGFSCNSVSKYIERLSKTFSLTNVMEFTYEDEHNNSNYEKVITATGPALHLMKSYGNKDVDEDLSTYSKIRQATIKRLNYDYRFITKIKPCVDIYLDLIEKYLDRIKLFDFRMKLIDTTGVLKYIPTDLLVSYKEGKEVNNILVRGVCNLDIYNKHDELDVTFFINLAQSYNSFIENKDYLDFHLPLSNNKPRLLLVGNDEYVLNVIRESFKEANISLDYIDILLYSETEEYFEQIFKAKKDWID